MKTYVVEVEITRRDSVELHVDVEDTDTEDDARHTATMLALSGQGLTTDRQVEEAHVLSIREWMR